MDSKQQGVQCEGTVCEWCDKEGGFEVCFPALIIHLLKPLWKEVELRAEEILFEA